MEEKREITNEGNSSDHPKEHDGIKNGGLIESPEPVMRSPVSSNLNGKANV
jgi:hypothetical protein